MEVISGFGLRPLAFGDADITGSGLLPTTDLGMPGFVPGFSLFGHNQFLIHRSPLAKGFIVNVAQKRA